MAVLLHKWEFKNIEAEFLKESEKIWSPGLPDIGARKSWDVLILTVSASTCRTPIYMYPSFANSVDPDQLASEEAKWSGSALFVIQYVNLYQQPGSINLIGWKLEVGEVS